MADIFDPTMVKFINNSFGGDNTKAKTKENKYAAPKRVKKGEKKLEDVRKKIAKNADKATTASGEIGQKDLPNIIQQVDPQGTAQVIPQMYQQMQMMLSLLSMGSGSSGGGSSGTSPTFSSIPSGISVVVNDSFTGALAILTRKYGFEEVIRVFDTALYETGAPGSDYGVSNLDPLYKNIVLNAIANLIRLALYFGPLNIPVSQYDNVEYGDIVPDKVIDIKAVPNLYKKVYYTLETDPYPGYQEWIAQDGTNKKVYTKKDAKSYNFTNMNQEIYSTSETEIAQDLDPYFQSTKIGERLYYYKFLTSKALNAILYKQMVNIEANTLNNGLGNNASSGGGSGSSAMAGLLGGMLMQLMQMLTSEQLPNSKIEGSTVLPQGEMQNMMQQFQKDMGMNNQIFELGKGILGGGGVGSMMGGSPLGMLNGMGGIGNIMGGFGMDGGGMGGVLGGMGMGSLMGGFGSFGGGSGGGGGAAGSGFGSSSGGGDYTGGGISTTGLSNIKSLLTKLGLQP